MNNTLNFKIIDLPMTKYIGLDKKNPLIAVFKNNINKATE